MRNILLAITLLIAGCGPAGTGNSTTSYVSPVPDTSKPEAIPEAAVTITPIFSGNFSCGGDITGTYSYQSNAPVYSDNVRGLSPNITYPLDKWEFTIIGCSGMPDTVFTNVNGNTAEFCLGVCQLGNEPIIQLTLQNEVMKLILIFALPGGQTAPPTLAQYGEILQSTCNVLCPVCVPFGIIQNGLLKEV